MNSVHIVNTEHHASTNSSNNNTKNVIDNTEDNNESINLSDNEASSSRNNYFHKDISQVTARLRQHYRNPTDENDQLSFSNNGRTKRNPNKRLSYSYAIDNNMEANFNNDLTTNTQIPRGVHQRRSAVAPSEVYFKKVFQNPRGKYLRRESLTPFLNFGGYRGIDWLYNKPRVWTTSTQLLRKRGNLNWNMNDM